MCREVAVQWKCVYSEMSSNLQWYWNAVNAKRNIINEKYNEYCVCVCNVSIEIQYNIILQYNIINVY